MAKYSKEIKTGIFAIVVLVSTVIVINLLRGSDILGREIELSGRFDDVATLVASAPVQIRGYVAGKVSAVEYVPENDDFLVTCTIDKRFRIPRDSRMMIYSTSIMGGKGIRIELGSSETPAADGDLIQAGIESDLVSSLSTSIVPLLGKLEDLADSLKTVGGNVNRILGKENYTYVKSSLAHLEKTICEARNLVSGLERDYSASSDEIKALVKNLSDFSEKLSPLADSAIATVGSTGQTVDTLKSAIVDINDKINKISEPLNSLLKDVDELIIDVKANPKKYIKISVF